MRRAALLLLSGCSFIAVRGPVRTTEPRGDPSRIQCTESDLLPSLDALGGAAAIAAGGAGIVLEHTSDSGEAKHFTAYYAGPLLVLAIVYFYSGSVGTSRVERCIEVKSAAASIEPVTPVDTRKPQPEIEINTDP